MRVIPVIDVLDGTVVRGVAGRRHEYLPIQSILTDSSSPLMVARAFRERLGLDALYVADLDAILHDRPHEPLFRDLTADGFELLVDAGVRDIERVRSILDAGAAAVIGLETVGDAALLESCVDEFGPERIVFSLDLTAGRPLGQTATWRSDDPFDIAAEARARGVERLIVLDLAGVGVGAGVPTLPLCRRIRGALPGLRLITGGGIRGPGDLRDLASIGLEGVLVASALHDGRLTREHWT